MYNAHSELFVFYDKHVRLPLGKQKELTTYRDTNLDRLDAGLTKLGFALPVKTYGQGSYAMSTMVQQPNNDYDIDTAIIFEADELPASALDARKQVLAGIIDGGGNFKKPPAARTNAVTVWYEEGHHIDLAVHRLLLNDYGSEVIQHAGTDWSCRDPRDINNWFTNAVAQKSPASSTGTTVKDSQMRRIVQLLKMFAKSRPSWNLPGGLLISVLVDECYISDPYRDDNAFYMTVIAIRNRIMRNTVILNPVDSSQELTYKDEYLNQVERFGEKLGNLIEWARPLMSPSCDEMTAFEAWKKVFQHEYWDELINGLELSQSAKNIYISPTGTVQVGKSTDKAVQSPPHRFYGDNFDDEAK